MAATTGAFAAYDGWNNLNMMAGEIKNPQRNITRSLIIGLWICILVYVVVTLSYMYVLPIGDMAKSPLVASDAISLVMVFPDGVDFIIPQLFFFIKSP